MNKTKKIGLTGMMGAGKSSVIEVLKQLGITVLDCDEINRHLIQKGNIGYQKILEVFGSDLCDQEGTLDVQKMSDRIFSQPKEKQKLEQILHPLIKEEIEAQCHACQEAMIVVEVPLLFEVHWETFFDETWVVTCAQEVLLQRLETYRHISRAEALRRLAHQMPQEQKCELADVILYNNQDKTYLKKQIEQVVQRIKEEGSCAE